MFLAISLKNKYRLAVFFLCFVFGFSARFLLKQTDLSRYNNTPVKIYNQHVKIPIDPDCPIKGKATKTTKIYHVPEGVGYIKLKATDCFQTEDEAVKAGFRKSKK
jgi:hypothetical protein